MLAKVDNIVVSHVAYISDMGDHSNEDLRVRFNVKKTDFPVYKLFVNGHSDPIDFTGNAEHTHELKRFIAKETGVYSL